MSIDATHAPLASTVPAISMRGLSVSFGANMVLRGIDLDIAAGEITALLGANGAGKSTMIKALSGANPHYDGHISIDGVERELSSPTIARSLGISTVHQKVADGVVKGLSVAENVTLDALADIRHHPLRDSAGDVEAARAALDRLHLSWPERFLRTDIRRLNISDAQLVTIARALRGEPKVLILDEPTSALTQSETARLFAVLHSLRDSGLALVYVSHRFGEIEELADRVVVLRDGRLQLDERKPFDWPAILTAMLGKQAELRQRSSAVRHGGAIVAKVQSARLLLESPPIDLDIRGGEILGVLGLIGAGKTELAETLAGVRRSPGAMMTMGGEPYRPSNPGDALARGVALVPEDRQAQSVLPGWSLGGNVTLPFLRRLSRWGVRNSRRETELARDAINALSIVATGPEQSIDDLSGGNQQKAVVARWLAAQPQLFILDEPFRGVDIGARRDIGRKLGDLVASGPAAIVLAGDVDEILDVADRVVVLVAGRITLDAYVDEVDEHSIVSAFLGQKDAPTDSEQV